MAEKTVTVGDTEVQITETEDGFEVEEAVGDAMAEYGIVENGMGLSDSEREVANKIVQAFADAHQTSMLDSIGSDSGRGLCVHLNEPISETSRNMASEFLDHQVAIYGVSSYDEKIWMDTIEHLDGME